MQVFNFYKKSLYFFERFTIHPTTIGTTAIKKNKRSRSKSCFWLLYIREQAYWDCQSLFLTFLAFLLKLSGDNNRKRVEGKMRNQANHGWESNYLLAMGVQQCQPQPEISPAILPIRSRYYYVLSVSCWQSTAFYSALLPSLKNTHFFRLCRKFFSLSFPNHNYKISCLTLLRCWLKSFSWLHEHPSCKKCMSPKHWM